MVNLCHVNEQGELKCDDRGPVKGPHFDAIRAALQGVAGISPTRLDCIVLLINEVLQSPLSDACIGERCDDTVKSVRYILDKTSPIMLLYEYFALPGNILATYYIQKGDYVAAHEAVQRWSKLKHRCEN